MQQGGFAEDRGVHLLVSCLGTAAAICIVARAGVEFPVPGAVLSELTVEAQMAPLEALRTEGDPMRDLGEVDRVGDTIDEELSLFRLMQNGRGDSARGVVQKRTLNSGHRW